MQILNLKMAKCLNQRNDNKFILLGNQLQLFNFSRTAQTDTYTLVNSWIYTLHTLVSRQICSNTVQTHTLWAMKHIAIYHCTQRVLLFFACFSESARSGPRETKRQTETERQTDTVRHTERQTDTLRHTERQTDTLRHTERQTDTVRHTERQRDN